MVEFNVTQHSDTILSGQKVSSSMRIQRLSCLLLSLGGGVKNFHVALGLSTPAARTLVPSGVLAVYKVNL